MYLAAGIIIVYTFWAASPPCAGPTSFQGLLMLGAAARRPHLRRVHAGIRPACPPSPPSTAETPHFWNPTASWQDIVSGLGGASAISECPTSSSASCPEVPGLPEKVRKDRHHLERAHPDLLRHRGRPSGRQFLGFDENINANSLCSSPWWRKIFPGDHSGILLSSILAASMSTADSQLLAAALRLRQRRVQAHHPQKRRSDKEMLWAGRYVVLLIAVIAVVIAANPKAGSIMDLVSNAWGVFGAAFGPVIMLSLFWKRFTFSGAVAGIVAGAAVDILWLAFLPPPHL
jgi:sodium/proline symporter